MTGPDQPADDGALHDSTHRADTRHQEADRGGGYRRGEHRSQPMPLRQQADRHRGQQSGDDARVGDEPAGHHERHATATHDRRHGQLHRLQWSAAHPGRYRRIHALVGPAHP
ncbi:MAG: hypothetical protein M0Z82_06015 [Actinomycetota bacterium]|nr:hypothetical protein [Actinomycetota bacterium]